MVGGDDSMGMWLSDCAGVSAGELHGTSVGLSNSTMEYGVVSMCVSDEADELGSLKETGRHVQKCNFVGWS